ncbi:hypothetical protein MMC16_004024 [Acarospora aff. strigata]|nr:hypothetical protein [Acarospora aff. strigata]
MALVAYSDSEGSDNETAAEVPRAAAIPPTPASTSSTKPIFQKVVDRSNPHKIRINLPEITRGEVDDHEADGGERSSKKIKTGGGNFSGFNAFLPAPKRALQGSSVGSQDGFGKRKGLGSGVNLKTGPSPGFSREAQVKISEEEANENPTVNNNDVESQNHGEGTSRHCDINGTAAVEKPIDTKPLVGTPMMFKPLSVARKPQKKKKDNSTVGPVSPSNRSAQASKPEKAIPKVSLFSMKESSTADTQPSTAPAGQYKPLIYDVGQGTSKTSLPEPHTDLDVEEGIASIYSTTSLDTPALSSGPQSLDSIASDLNLSASAKRQLFGRQRSSRNANSSAINIVNFNTDEEYAANEALRAAGEQVQHNPVRAIAPGKHSLKQLVNAASTQKDALEEHFASGKRNKKEAGSKYGW